MKCLTSKSIAISVISLFAVFLFIAEAQAQKILGYWRFEEGNGEAKEVKDSSEMGNHGGISGDCEWTEGKFGGGLLIKGVSGWIVVPNDTISESLKAANAMTLAAWVQPVKYVDEALQLHSDGANYFLRVFPERVDPGINIGGWKGVDAGSMAIEEGQWYHVAATYDGETLISYLNGGMEDSVIVGGQLPAGGDLFIGTTGWRAGGGYGSGILDEVLIADYAFTEAELVEAMEAGEPVEPAGKLSSTWGEVKSGY
jgi:hypothetical protein